MSLDENAKDARIGITSSAGEDLIVVGYRLENVADHRIRTVGAEPRSSTGNIVEVS